MTAADVSKRQHGAEVTLESVLAPARLEAAKKLANKLPTPDRQEKRG